MTFAVRRFVTADTAACAAIFEAAWHTALPHAQRQISGATFQRETDGEAIWIAECEGRVVGFVALWMDEAFVHHLYVLPAQHGRGVGRLLMQQADAVTGDAPLALKCQQRNTAALAFYRGLGFAETTRTGLDEYGDWVELRQTRPIG